MSMPIKTFLVAAVACFSATLAFAGELTLNQFGTLGPHDLAQLALGELLGPSPEIFPAHGKSITAGAIIYGIPINALDLCRVLGVQISFERVGPDKLAVSQYHAAWRYYFEPLSQGALDRRCKNAVGRRPTFEAPTLPSAEGAVKDVQILAATAARDGALPFELKVHCEGGPLCHDDVSPRERAAVLRPEDIVRIRSVGLGQDGEIEEVELAHGGMPETYWDVRFFRETQSASRFDKVEMYSEINAVP